MFTQLSSMAFLCKRHSPPIRILIFAIFLGRKKKKVNKAAVPNTLLKSLIAVNQPAS